MNKISRAAATLAAAVALATSTLAMAAGFDARMSQLIEHIKADPNYKRIPLATSEDRVWFSEEARALYDKKISKDEFVAEGARHFPGYEASFTEVANFLTAS